MGEMFGGHEIVGFNDLLDVIAVNPNSNTHDHVLWSFGDFAIDSQEIGPLHCLEAKVVVVEILVIDNGRVEFFGMSHDNVVGLLRDHRTRLVILGVDIDVEVMDDLRELFLSLLVQIRNGNTKIVSVKLSDKLPSGEDGVVGVFGGHVSRGLGGKIVEFDCRYSLTY